MQNDALRSVAIRGCESQADSGGEAEACLFLSIPLGASHAAWRSEVLGAPAKRGRGPGLCASHVPARLRPKHKAPRPRPRRRHSPAGSGAQPGRCSQILPDCRPQARACLQPSPASGREAASGIQSANKAPTEAARREASLRGHGRVPWGSQAQICVTRARSRGALKQHLGWPADRQVLPGKGPRPPLRNARALVGCAARCLHGGWGTVRLSPQLLE